MLYYIGKENLTHVLRECLWYFEIFLGSRKGDPLTRRLLETVVSAVIFTCPKSIPRVFGSLVYISSSRPLAKYVPIPSAVARRRLLPN